MLENSTSAVEMSEGRRFDSITRVRAGEGVAGMR
jgi:hypothetical protein